ncbi:DUF4142 domain-containing protein [Pontibacter amylolyticus]|uniref:DUF4142 domain-containing protein n=1 Tax=Pontibacter amylolyticus TaxID=1424080 RepID=A0ABQ1W9I4_9BACT|nr:DUF4142 domain-containing protein [Pontibacter amylolyticus]GGG20460.1 hypothetical protein GCM10011323_25630 [Pontibacter amylolyticus]
MKRFEKFTMKTAALFLGVFAFGSTVLAQGNPTLSDAEVASAAVTANQIDIDFAAIAREKSKDTQVLEFARTMANDHQAVIDQAVALTEKLSVTPKDNAVSQQLKADAEKTKEQLRAKSGKAFDKAYIDNEVAYHTSVIAAVKDLLIPETENAELKDLLMSVVPALEAHLEHAKMIQQKMSKK